MARGTARARKGHGRNPSAESVEGVDGEGDPLSMDAPSSELDNDTLNEHPSPGGTKTRRRGRLLQLYVPTFPVFSSAFVFAIFALLAPVADRAYHRLATEGRLASDVPSVAHELGRFQVKWDKTDLRLTVRARGRRPPLARFPVLRVASSASRRSRLGLTTP